MSSKSTVYLQPSGLIAIDTAIAAVVKALNDGRYEDAIQSLRVYAGATLKEDIITFAENFYKEIQAEKNLRDASQGITIADTYINKNIKTELWKREIALKFYFKMMMLSSEYGVAAKHPKEIPSNRSSCDGKSQLFETG